MELIIYKYLPIGDEISKHHTQVSDDVKTAADYQRTAFKILEVGVDENQV